MIGANVPHSIANPDGPLCLLYLEKASNDFRSILDYQGLIRSEPLVLEGGVSPDLLESLRAGLFGPLNLAQAEKLKRGCLHFFGGSLADPKPLEPRIGKILNHLHEEPGRAYSGDELARIAGLSPSRMQHLFKQQLGIPVRKYILWTRLRYALNLALSGKSLTEVAHQSGFSDSAHFSRTFKSMFGVAPSSLMSTSANVTPLFCD